MEQAMRLGIITPHVGRNDGQGRVNREIAEEALRRGHQVVVFAEHVDADLAGAGCAQAVPLPPPRWLPSRLLRDQALALRTWGGVRAAENQCDALLANGFVSWARSDINVVHFVHASWKASPYHPWRLGRSARSLYAMTYSRVNAVLERGAFRRAARIVAVSGSVRQDLLRLGVPEDRITTILNGVDLDEFHPGSPERRRFALPPDVPIALFAGDLKTSRKNLDTVLRALRSVPVLHLAVAGRHERTSYPDQARALGVEKRVHFLGFQKDMAALMRSADLFVFPSRYETCGLVLLEALASGIPVVTARSVGGAELIGDDVGVVLEDSEDPAVLASALSALVDNASRRSDMARSARALAEQHSWASMARRHVNLLEDTARERRPTVPA
jgi:glycosyltransferase involved in cell wall biosynthesis